MPRPSRLLTSACGALLAALTLAAPAFGQHVELAPAPFDDAPAAAASSGAYGVRNPRGFRLGGGLGTGYVMRESKLGSGAFVRPMLALSVYGRAPVGRRLTLGLDAIAQHRADRLRRNDQVGTRRANFVHFQSLEAAATLEFLFDNRVCDAYLLAGAQGIIGYRQQLSENYLDFDEVDERFDFYDNVRRVRPLVGLRISKEVADYLYLDADLRAIGPEEFEHVDGQDEAGAQFALRLGLSYAF